MKKSLVTLFVVGCLALLMMLPLSSTEAATNILPTAQDNLRVGLRRTSQLVATSTGYMRVFYDGKKIAIEYYDSNFNIQEKKSIAMELSMWGGFYAGKDAYYLVEGQANTGESDTAEVIRVLKYDTSWNKKGTAKITGNPKIFGGEVRHPFDNGCVEMTEYNGTLYIVTGHQGYVDPQYNQGHQGFLMVAVNTASMTGEIVDCDLWHSFAQYINGKDSNLYVLEQSEGSRYTKLSKYDANSLEKTALPVLEYGGTQTSAWAISCYASVDGMALSSNNVLCLGTSIDQSKYDSVSSKTAHNIYLTVTPTANFSEEATTVKWLTDYKDNENDNGKSFLGTKIVKIDDNRFMISWEEFETSQTASIEDGLSGSILHYVFIDGSGNKISEEFTAPAPISDCQPIVKGENIVYYASNANMVNFYSIDAQTGKFSKKVYRVAGENVIWELSDNVLTLSGTGAIAVDTEAHYRYPVSSTANDFSHYSSDNAWKPIRERVKKIIVGKGITSIPESAFEYFDQLTEVKIESGLKSIGKKAFYGCDKLSKITIPSSVTTLGEDFLWTGSYWVWDESHVIRATIYTPDNSYAMKYAKENKIKYVVSNDASAKTSILNAQVSGVKKTYTYNGKAQKPQVTVKLGNKTLKKGTDYTISYLNNTNLGTASVKIAGVGKYTGTKTVSFKINLGVPSSAKQSARTTTSIKLSWKKVAGATSYVVERAPYGSKKFRKTATVKTTSYTNKKLATGQYYQYRVRAYRGKNASAYSKTITANTSIPTPSLSKVTSPKKKQAVVTWKKTKGVSGYQVYRATSKNGKYKKVATVKSTKYTDKKVSSKKTYYYKVRAYKKVKSKTIYSGYSKIKGKRVK